MPCNDKEDCKFMSPNESIDYTNQHSGHETDSEQCTPFCLCACCGQSFNSSFYDLNLFPIYKTSFISEGYLSIWQPPKIV